MSGSDEEVSTDCQSSEDEGPTKPPNLVSESGVLGVSVSGDKDKGIDTQDKRIGLRDNRQMIR